MGHAVCQEHSVSSQRELKQKSRRMVRLSCIALIAGFALTCVLAGELDGQFYSDRFDNIDMNAIFTNDKLRLAYYNCFMDIKPCTTAPQKFFKEILGDAIATQCKKCTEKQKENLEFMIDWYTKNNPSEWETLVKKVLEDIQKSKSQ